MSRTVLVVGGSRGIGAAVANYLCDKGDRVYSVSRSPSTAGDWIKADVSTTAGIQAIRDAVGSESLDALLYMGGVWEKNAFTDGYDFLKSSGEETRFVVNVNAIAPIEITRALSENLAKAKNPRAIYIGALSGLDHLASAEVANTASKFALRGAIQALRIALRRHQIGFTVINPGNVATEEVMLDIEEGRFSAQTPIPLQDIFSTIEWILGVSRSVEIGEVNLWQK